MREELAKVVSELERLQGEHAQALVDCRALWEAQRRATRAQAEMRTLAIRFIVANNRQLRAHRENMNVPQKAVARAAGVCRPYITCLEAGRVITLGQATLVRMLQAYGEL